VNRKNSIAKYSSEFAKQRDGSTATTSVDFGSSAFGPTACGVSPLGDTHHRKGAVEISEGSIADVIRSSIGMTYGARLIHFIALLQV
jgi:hypothetical protein